MNKHKHIEFRGCSKLQGTLHKRRAPVKDTTKLYRKPSEDPDDERTDQRNLNAWPEDRESDEG